MFFQKKIFVAQPIRLILDNQDVKGRFCRYQFTQKEPVSCFAFWCFCLFCSGGGVDVVEVCVSVLVI